MLVFKGLGRTDGSLLVYFNRVWLGRDPDTLGVAEGGGACAQVCTGHLPTYESVILKTPLTACSLNTICAPLETHNSRRGGGTERMRKLMKLDSYCFWGKCEWCKTACQIVLFDSMGLFVCRLGSHTQQALMINSDFCSDLTFLVCCSHSI